MEFTRIEGALFNPLPQKVPMRYSFSLEQKRILMKHYENGMHGQSLAYQDKIVACAQEAGVDFDIVRNWIGNMRRKRRMETAQKNPMSAMMLQHDTSIENKRRFMAPSASGGFGGPQYYIRHPSNTAQQPHQMASMGVANTQGPPMPVPTSILRNAPLSTRDQNVTPPTSGQPTMGAPGVYTAPSTKQEGDVDRPSCLVPGAPHQSTAQPQQGTSNPASGDRFPDETIPVIRAQGTGQSKEAEDLEWRQQQIQRIMQQVQQSVHQLESLSCECVVATVVPSDGGTYITGTPIAVQYFSEIQKIQPMADYVNPASPPSVNSDSTPNDAIEDNSNARNTPRNQPMQGTSGKDESSHGDCARDVGEGNTTEGGKDSKVEVERRDGEVIRAGEEVYIVNKEHYIIGTGTLLPGPHKQIELKNAPL